MYFSLVLYGYIVYNNDYRFYCRVYYSVFCLESRDKLKKPEVARVHKINSLISWQLHKLNEIIEGDNVR